MMGEIKKVNEAWPNQKLEINGRTFKLPTQKLVAKVF